MSANKIEQRYANSLIRLVESDQESAKKIQLVFSDLLTVFKDEFVVKMLSSPVMPEQNKLDIIDQVSANHGKNLIFSNFLNVLSKAGRLHLLPGIAVAFRKLLDKKLKILRITLTSPTQLGIPQIKEIEMLLKEKFGGIEKIETKLEIDQGLLGGLVVRVGNRVLDMSLRAKLLELQK